MPVAYISNATTLINAAHPRIAIPGAAIWSSGAAAVGIALGMLVFA